ncbi:MAG TPA: META domain-containing protein [Candidatus Binatia bacterium]|nr:META domain-containing protein [Candidatus Binatia bacterium]
MIPRVLRSSLVFLLLLGMVASAPRRACASDRVTIAGSATYRERMALPPGAVFEATLEDASAKVIARFRKKNPGQVPLAFEITYDPSRIDAPRHCVVRASIQEKGQLLFTGSKAFSTKSHGRGREVIVLMRRVATKPHEDRRPKENRKSRVEAELGNTRWRSIRIGDRPVVISGHEREPWIQLDPRAQRVTGSGGCNRITGSYESGRDALRFRGLNTTQMACVSIETETAFLRALNQTRRYRIIGRTLQLMDDLGRPLAQLEEGNLR